jgi:HK97 family phage major capsid protein
MPSILELKQQKHALAVEMRKKLDSTSPTALTEYKALADQVEAINARQIAMEGQTELEGVLARVDHPGRPNLGTEDLQASVRRYTPKDKEFEIYLRTGVQSPEMRALGAATGADGSTIVPAGFEQELETTMKYFGGIQNICRVLTTTTGQPLTFPTLDDTSNSGEWLAEAAPITSADPTFGSVIFGANLLSSKLVKVSVALEQDSAFDIGGLLSNAFGERLGRALDTALWTGGGRPFRPSSRCQCKHRRSRGQ